MSNDHCIVEKNSAYLNTTTSNGNNVPGFDVANEERAPREFSSDKSCKCEKRQNFRQHRKKDTEE